ncbi:MAG: hypothetical protein RXO24_12420, partial [Acidilobus sp.]
LTDGLVVTPIGVAVATLTAVGLFKLVMKRMQTSGLAVYHSSSPLNVPVTASPFNRFPHKFEWKRTDIALIGLGFSQASILGPTDLASEINWWLAERSTQPPS